MTLRQKDLILSVMLLVLLVVSARVEGQDGDYVACEAISTKAEPTAGEAPLTVQFSSSHAGFLCCDSTGYTTGPIGWAFGDGTYSAEQNPSHTYASPGTYKWQARVMNYASDCGETFWCEGCYLTGAITVNSINSPDSRGGGEDNPYTEFEGGDGPGECGGGMPNYSVNTSTLNLFVSDTDFSYQGLGPKIAMTHSYNSGTGQTGMFGKNWRFTHESSLTQTCTEATLQKGSGQALTFSATLCNGGNPVAPPVEATPPAGRLDRLTWYGDYWLLREKETRLTYRFDRASGKNVSTLSSITDANGNGIMISYNADLTIQSITDAAGRNTVFGYDGSGRCISMTTPDGRNAEYEYDAQGNLVRSVDLAGYVTYYTYDSEGDMTSMVAAGITTSFTYETTGVWKHVASLTDSRGNMTRYEVVSTAPRTIKSIDPEGNATTYGSGGNLTTTVTDALGRTVSRTFSGGRPATVTDGLGNITRTEYDTRGNLVKRTDQLGHVTLYGYDAGDNMVSKTDALGQTWTYGYDARSNLVSVTSPRGHRTSMTYDAKGLMTARMDATGHTTSYTYDAFGNLATITDSLGNTTTMAYDTHGFARTSITDARGNQTSFTYDENLRVTRETNADSTFRSYGYDCCAMSSVTDENGNTTTFTRNPLLFVTEITDPLGNKTLKEYDKNNNLTAVTNPLGHVTATSYDAVNRPVMVTDARGETSRNVYDANGSRTSVTDERGRETRFTFDAANRQTSVTDPLGYEVSLQRDGLGRLSLVTNARGNTIEYDYDLDGRLTTKRYDGKVNGQYTRDGEGNLTRMTDTTGTTTYGYDARQRVNHITYPDGLELSISYDGAGNVESITYPGGVSATYTYDQRNRAASVSWSGESMEFNYDGVGNLVREVRSNGTETDTAYDANSRLISIRHLKGETSLARVEYTRNGLGNTTQERAVPPRNPSFSSGTITATYNELNQIVTRGANTYTYDADGNRVGVTGNVNSTSTYDPENRLISDTASGQTVLYAYNGLGQRVRLEKSNEVRRYHHDPLGRVMFETDSAGRITCYFIHGAGRIVALGAPSTGFHFFHFDKNGSTLALTDSAGAVSGSYVYLPFGWISNRSGSTYNPFTFVGAHGVMEDGNGFSFMKNRYYSSATGRFFQKDPIGLAGGLNVYAYVGNNPVERIDPEGLFEIFSATTLIVTYGAYTAVNLITNIYSFNEERKLRNFYEENVQHKREFYSRKLKEGYDKSLKQCPIGAPGSEAARAAIELAYRQNWQAYYKEKIWPIENLSDNTWWRMAGDAFLIIKDSMGLKGLMGY
jgi:RHS repeat-associated protein